MSDESFEVNDLLMNMTRLAKLTGKDKAILYRAVKAGKLKTVKRGEERLVNEEALAAYLNDALQARRCFDAHWVAENGRALSDAILAGFHQVWQNRAIQDAVIDALGTKAEVRAHNQLAAYFDEGGKRDLQTVCAIVHQIGVEVATEE